MGHKGAHNRHAKCVSDPAPVVAVAASSLLSTSPMVVLAVSRSGPFTPHCVERRGHSGKLPWTPKPCITAKNVDKTGGGIIVSNDLCTMWAGRPPCKIKTDESVNSPNTTCGETSPAGLCFESP